MKLQPPENPNYAATVVRVKNVVQLPGLDNLVGAPLLGYQALISKDWQIGDLGILFTAETQLSEIFARENNLHRHENLNASPDQKGYLEDNRRIKALKFRGNRSDALLLPLSSVRHFIDPDVLTEGDTFDRLDGVEICRKYVVPSTRGKGRNVARALKQTRVEEKLFPKHFDTENYFRNVDKLKPEDFVYITQKLHGTSIRIGHTLVNRRLKWYEKLARKLGVKVQEQEYDYVFGSRNVTKDANDPTQTHFYGTDLYSNEGRKLQGSLPAGVMVFGELVGWTPDRVPLQPGYTYRVPEGFCELFIYRVATINGQGILVDLSWSQVKEFCATQGLKHVPELWAGFYGDMPAIEKWLDVKFRDEYPQALDVEAKVDEGVCIRRDGITPLVLKAKSPLFLQHETKMLDKGTVDIEEFGLEEADTEEEG